MKAWGLGNCKLARLLKNALKWRYYVEGLRGAKDSDIFKQFNALRTGAPESPAIFIFTFEV